MDAPTASWELPAELQQWSWLRDGLHVPRPLPPLASDSWQSVMRMFGGQPTVILNGYLYLGLAPGHQTPNLEQAPQESAGAAWREFYFPRVKAIATRIRATDYAAMTRAELAGAIPTLLDEVGVGFGYTMLPLGKLGEPLNDLMAFCGAHFGAEGDLIATTLLQGAANETTATGDALGALAEIAAGTPEVASALRERRFGDIRSFSGSEAFVAELDAYLDEYGSGNHTWAEIQNPTWQEDPTIPLEMIARYVESPGSVPSGSRERSGVGRDDALAAALARLGTDDRTKLQALVEATADYVPIIEERARWQLSLMGALRPPYLALGALLTTGGMLESRDDVFYLHVREVTGEPEDFRERAAVRRAEVRSWRELSPPISVGAPLPPGLDRVPMLGKMFGFSSAPASADGPLKGLAASRGVARGTARVILDLEDAHRLGPGEILVCPFTAPPWTPLFAIAGAVVTDAGGVLSHAAIAAREYGIPCVTGTREGTTRIPDGALIEVDGAGGTITVLGPG